MSSSIGTEGDATAGFSYPLPSLRSPVPQCELPGRCPFVQDSIEHSGETEVPRSRKLKVARYSADKQQDNGSWEYGEFSTYHWVDNFHTGYNLCALRSISESADTSEFDARIRRGFDYYRRQLFQGRRRAQVFPRSHVSHRYS